MLEIQRVVAHAPTKPSVLHHLRHRPCLLLMALLPSLSLIQAGRQGTRMRRQSAAELSGHEGRTTCTTGCDDENEPETNAIGNVMPGLGDHTSSKLKTLLLIFVLCAVNTMMVDFIVAAPPGSLSRTICCTTLREEDTATCPASTAASWVIQAPQQSLKRPGRGRRKRARGDNDKEEYEDEGMDKVTALATSTVGLRRSQPSTELIFLMPRDSPLLSAATAGYMGYLEKVRGKGVKHDHGPPRLARAMAILQYLCATPPPATIQHEEHLKLIEWAHDLAELNIMEACTLVRQCHTADCHDVAGQPRLHRLHIHLDSIVMIGHNFVSMKQLFTRNLTGLSDQNQARACGPSASHPHHERQARQALRNLTGGGRR